MSWDRIKQRWTAWPGRVRQGWLELTDDDFDIASGRRDALAGQLRDRFGISDETAEAQERERQRTLAASWAKGRPGLKR